MTRAKAAYRFLTIAALLILFAVAVHAFEEFPAFHQTQQKVAEKLLLRQQQLENIMEFYNDPENHPGEPHPNFTDIETPTQCDPGEPLFLSPYIASNRAAEGRAAARVYLPNSTFDKSLPEIRSYSGFLTVNASDFGNLFFWFLETTNQSATQPPEERPLVIWLQGGPGASGMYGLFVLHGPYGIDENTVLYRRSAYSWLETANLLYIDQPVGTGFSITATDDGYAKSQVQVGWNLYTFMQEFYKLFPNMLKSKLFITGESYAGKYVPTFGYRIHERNTNGSDVKIPLAGIAVGNGLTDPENMIEGLGPLMYGLGMATTAERAHIDAETKAIRKLIQEKNFKAARPSFADVLTGGPRGSYFTNITGSTNYYNILLSESPAEEWYFQKYLTLCDVRQAIHVGNLSYGGVLTTAAVKYYLDDDFLDTVRHWLPPLIDNYRVMYYNGQLDIIVGVAITERFLRALEGWSWKQEYLDADRVVWKVKDSDQDVAGYAKLVRGSFYQVVIRGAGHMVPHDQPRRGFDMLRRFIEGETFGNKTVKRFHFDTDEDGAWIRDL